MTECHRRRSAATATRSADRPTNASRPAVHAAGTGAKKAGARARKRCLLPSFKDPNLPRLFINESLKEDDRPPRGTRGDSRLAAVAEWPRSARARRARACVPMIAPPTAAGLAAASATLRRSGPGATSPRARIVIRAPSRSRSTIRRDGLPLVPRAGTLGVRGGDATGRRPPRARGSRPAAGGPRSAGDARAQDGAREERATGRRDTRGATCDELLRPRRGCSERGPYCGRLPRGHAARGSANLAKSSTARLPVTRTGEARRLASTTRSRAAASAGEVRRYCGHTQGGGGPGPGRRGAAVQLENFAADQRAAERAATA